MRRPLRWAIVIAGAALTLVWVVWSLVVSDWLNGWLIGPVLLVIAVLEWRSWGMLDDAFGRSPDGDGFFAKHSDSLSKRFRDAPIGVGTIVSVSPTGTSINDEPQYDIELDVETPQGRAFRGVTREVLGVHEVGDYRVGSVFPVRYRHDGDRVAFVTGASDVEVEDAQLAVERVFGRLSEEGLRVYRSGVVANAVLRASRPTGEIRDGLGVLALELTVTRPDGTTFDVEMEDALLPEALRRMLPGNVIQVRYLADDESALALVYPNE